MTRNNTSSGSRLPWLAALLLLLLPAPLKAQVDRLELALARAKQPSWSLSIATNYGENANSLANSIGYRFNIRRARSKSFTSLSLGTSSSRSPFGSDAATNRQINFSFGKDKAQENGWWRTHSANFSFEEGEQGIWEWQTSGVQTDLTWTMTYDPFILSPFVSVSVDEHIDEWIAKTQNLYIDFGATAIFLANPQISAHAGVSAHGYQQLRPFVHGVDFSPWVSFGIAVSTASQRYTTSLDYGYAPAGNRYQLTLKLSRKLTGLE